METKTIDHLLIIGPYERRTGGAYVSFCQLIDSFDTDYPELKKTVVSTQKTRSNILNLVFSMVGISRAIFKSNIVMLNVSERGLIFLGLYCVLINTVFRKKLCLRVFGGDLDSILKNSSWLKKKIIIFIINNFHLLLLQTKFLMSYFSKIKEIRVNLEWFPTNRNLTPIKNSSVRARKFYYGGYIRENKGVNIILNALDFMEESCEFNFYGEIQEKTFLEKIEKSKANYIGNISHNKFIKKVFEEDVLVFPSSHEGEGYPGIMIEALFLGKPIIATEFRSLPEIVNGNGLLIQANDPKVLASAMDKLIRNQDLYKKLSDNAFKHASNFKSSHWIKILLENYFSSIV